MRNTSASIVPVTTQEVCLKARFLDRLYDMSGSCPVRIVLHLRLASQEIDRSPLHANEPHTLYPSELDPAKL